jgi:hypothetical protein
MKVFLPLEKELKLMSGRLLVRALLTSIAAEKSPGTDRVK